MVTPEEHSREEGFESISSDSKTKRRLHDRKTEHFRVLVKTDHRSAIADHVKNHGTHHQVGSF